MLKNIMGIVFFLFIINITGHTQGLRIEGYAKNLKSTPLILLQHFGGHVMPIDTVLVDNTGKFVFEYNKKIPQGVCRIVGIDKSYIELIVANDQQFIMQFDAKNILNTITFTNSPENTLFIAYQRYTRQWYQGYREAKQKAGITNDNDPRAKGLFNVLNDRVKKYIDSIYIANKQSFTAQFLKSFQEPKLPVMMQASTDSSYIQHYLRKNYFENSFLSDERMLYTPNIPKRIVSFIKNLPSLSTREIINLIDNTISQTNGTQSMKKFVIQNWAQQFEFTPYPKNDTLYDYTVNKYVQQTPAIWDASTLQKIKEIKQIKQNLAVGNTFPTMTMTDTNNTVQPLMAIQSPYTLLFFYEPGCTHCQDAAPQIQQVLKQNSDMLKVYAVSISDNENAWKEFIKMLHTEDFINVQDATHKTDFYKLGVINYPTIYLLNRDKKIVARWLNASQVTSYLKR